MLEKLDPEQLGIVTLNAFMEEFYPNHNPDNILHSFALHHYNGLKRSCPDNKVSTVLNSSSLRHTLSTRKAERQGTHCQQGVEQTSTLSAVGRCFIYFDPECEADGSVLNDV